MRFFQMQCNCCPCLALPAKRSNRLQMFPQWALVGFCVALRHTLSGVFCTHRVHVPGGFVLNWVRLLVQLALAFFFGIHFR